MRSKKYRKSRHFKKRNLSSKRKMRRVRSKRSKIKRTRNLSSNQLGGGIPFAGTLTNLVGLTHNNNENMDGLLENLCTINNSKRPQGGDIELHNLINQVCNVNHNIKKSKKNSGIVKGAMRLIGNIATLPLRTASKAVTSVTGINPAEMVTNMVVNNVNAKKQDENPYKIIPNVDTLKKIDDKIKSGGSLTEEDMAVLKSLE